MEDGSVNTVGILPADCSLGMEALLEPWLDIIETDDGRYPYTVRHEDAAENETGKSTHRAELRELVRGCSTVKLGRARGDQLFRYGELEVTVTVYGPSCPYHLAPYWRVWTDQYQFRPALQPDDTATERTAQLRELARTAHLRTKSVYTYTQRFAQVFDSAVHVNRERVCAGTLDELYWVTILGPDVVETVGRAALLAVGADRAEPLEDGSVLLVVGETPIDRDVPAFQRIREKLSVE
jgi:hypothetical protein